MVISQEVFERFMELSYDQGLHAGTIEGMNKACEIAIRLFRENQPTNLDNNK